MKKFVTMFAILCLLTSLSNSLLCMQTKHKTQKQISFQDPIKKRKKSCDDLLDEFMAATEVGYVCEKLCGDSKKLFFWFLKFVSGSDDSFDKEK